MIIQIHVTGTLQGLEAQMRRSTYDAIQRGNGRPPSSSTDVEVSNLNFAPAYMLRLVADIECPGNTLLVTPDVKRLFYPDVTSLTIPTRIPTR